MGYRPSDAKYYAEYTRRLLLPQPQVENIALAPYIELLPTSAEILIGFTTALAIGKKLKKYFNQERVDNIGVCLSSACAIHCMAMPLLVTILPLIGLGFLAREPAELIIITSALALASGSVVWGVRYHKSWRAFLILVVAAAFIATAHIATEGIFEVVLHSTGGILLAAAHLLNRYLCKICPVCEREHTGDSH